MTRQERFAQVLERFGQTADDYDQGEEEDPRPYLSGEEECRRFCCITIHEGKVFFLPTFETREEAQGRAVEYAQDDVFPELPVGVLDLDTGDTFYPQWDSLPWAKRDPMMGSQYRDVILGKD